MKIKIKKLIPEAVIPVKAHSTDAGLDLVAVSKKFEGGNIVYGTGLAIEIPKGYVGLLFPRSSISRYDISLTNAVGVVDSGYRGEIMAKFKPMIAGAGGEHNGMIIPFEGPIASYNVGDRIAQLLIIPYPEVEFEEVVTLSETDRGEGGYGSTGV